MGQKIHAEERESTDQRIAQREMVTLGEIEKKTEDGQDSQFKLSKLKACKAYQRENNALEEIKFSIQNLNRMSHDILLLQNDIEDQIILGEQIHNDHGRMEL